MIDYKWFRCYIFSIFFYSFIYSSQISDNNLIPFGLYLECIIALNKYRESGTNTWLLLCYEKLWELTNDYIVSDPNIDDFLKKHPGEYAGLQDRLSDEYVIFLRKSINTAFIQQYTPQLCSLLLSYFTPDNIHNSGLRSDAIIILNLFQEQLKMTINVDIDEVINYLKAENFIDNIDQQDLMDAQKIILFLCSSLAKTRKEPISLEQKESIQSQQLKTNSPIISLSKQELKALQDLLFSQNKKLLGISPSLHRTEALRSPQKRISSVNQEISPEEPINQETTLFSLITDFLTTIKNKIFSFFESLFKRSDDQPWQWK